jgi:hypothetical protein
MMLKHSSAALFLIAALALTLPVAAQEDSKPRPRREAMRVVAYPFENANPDEARMLLSTLFQAQGRVSAQDVRISSDRRTQTVIVFAPDSIHQHIEGLLSTIDRRVEGATGAEETRIITLQHLNVGSLYAVVQLHPLQSTMISATNSFIVRGEKAELDRLSETLAALDIDTPAIELEGWVLEHGKGSMIASHPELAPLAQEMTRAGLDGYGVFSHWSVRSLAGENFMSNQQFVQRRMRGLSVEGSVRLVDGGKNAQIELSLSVSMALDDTDDESKQTSSGSFNLDTLLKTQPGKLVVVGLAPTGDENSKPLALVLRVKQ